MAGLLGGGLLLAGVVAAALTSLVGTGAVPGLPDAGTLTRVGLPVARALAEAAGALTVGFALFAAFLAPHRKNGYVDVAGYAALRSATWAAVVWALAAGLLVPLTVADAVGRPLGDVLDVGVLAEAVPNLDQAEAWLLTAGLAVVVAVGSRLTLSWGWSVVLFAVAVGGLLPLGVNGHSSAGGSHDVATNSLLYHLVAAALWIGGLAALLAHGHRAGGHLPLVTSRFSRLALVCWLVMAASGVINVLVRIPVSSLLGSDYGRLVLGKVGALLVLGVIGYWQRGRSVRAVMERGDRSSLMRLGVVEMLVMLGTVGLAVGLARTPPPVGEARELSVTEVLLGYDLTGPPTLARLVLEWRFDLIYGVGALVAATLYLLGVRRLRLRGDRWPVGRTVAWLAGCVVVLVATSSGVGRYAPAMFSMHMVSHMLLSMLAPALLVLGGAMTLALRALPVARGAALGPREWLLELVRSPLARVLTHPVVALVLFVGSFYGLYFSGLFDLALSEHWAHLAMNAHFLLVGYIFYWPVIGIDPAPRRLPPLGRLALVFVSLPFHAFFGIVLMSSQTVIGGDFYRALAQGLTWAPDLLDDQRLGGGLAWASGELPLLVVLVALLVQWARTDERAGRRADRRADTDGDADLAAYNAMLRDLAGRSEPRR
jgi:cytochrome c oxidase assembly factor CtaG/putative copper export protein